MKVDLQGRRARPVRQRAPALHRLEGAQRGPARGGRPPRPARVASTGSSTTRRARRRAAPPRRRCTSGSGCRGSRPSCARAAASSRPRAAGRGCRSWSSSRTCAATCTATRRSPTAARTLEAMVERARARGYEYLAITDHSATHGFGDHVDADALRGADRAVAGARRDARRLRRVLDRDRDEHPPGRLARLPGRAARRARLGRSPPSTPRSGCASRR